MRRIPATRAPVSVREATPGDLPQLLAMWCEQRGGAARADRTLSAAPETDVLARLDELRGDPDARVVVGTHEERLAGAALFTRERLAPLADARVVHVHYLHVQDGARRRGVGRALLAAAVAYAEECGAEQVVASVSPQLREANRFYARLGLAPVMVRRVSSVSGLRRRILPEVREALVDEVVARRRAVRARSRVRALSH